MGKLFAKHLLLFFAGAFEVPEGGGVADVCDAGEAGVEVCDGCEGVGDSAGAGDPIPGSTTVPGWLDVFCFSSSISCRNH